MNWKKTIFASAFAVFSSFAFAGAFQEVPVEINFEGRSAAGNMTTARFSANPDEYIGCGVRNTLLGDGSLFRLGFCQASVAPDVTIVCFTENPVLVDEMAEGSDYSFITFGWNEFEECTRVGFSTQSFYIPEHLDKTKKK